MDDDGLKHLKGIDVITGETSESTYELDGIRDPTSAKVICKHNLRLDYDASSETPIKTEVTSVSIMTCDLNNFNLDESIKVTLNGESFYENSYITSVPRSFRFVFVLLAMCTMCTEQ